MRLKTRCALILCVAALTLFTACGRHGSFNSTSADPQKIADSIKSGAEFTDELTEISSDAAIKRYGLTQGDLQSAVVYIGTGSTAEEIAVFKAKDSNAAGGMLKKAQSFIQTQEDNYADYKPAEVPKLKSAVVEQKDNFVVLCVSADNNKAKSLISGLLS
jgi:hypothetical protein